MGDAQRVLRRLPPRAEGTERRGRDARGDAVRARRRDGHDLRRDHRPADIQHARRQVTHRARHGRHHRPRLPPRVLLHQHQELRAG